MKPTVTPRILAVLASTVITLLLFEQVALMGMPPPDAGLVIVHAPPAVLQSRA